MIVEGFRFMWVPSHVGCMKKRQTLGRLRQPPKSRVRVSYAISEINDLVGEKSMSRWQIRYFHGITK